MKVQAIIPTAGMGVRLKASKPKPFVEVCGKPLCVHTLMVFERSPVIDSIVLVGNPQHLLDLGNMVTQHHLKKVKRIVAGGETRRISVANGLAAVDEDTDMIVVHDGARPLVSLRIIDEAVGLCQETGAAVVAVPVKSTVKKVRPVELSVVETIDRDGLWEIQTPQVFKKDILVKAHQQRDEKTVTDDAMLVERLEIKVKILRGDYQNIKVTTQEDLTIAEAFMKIRQE